jgi:hypothetical protein
LALTQPEVGRAGSAREPELERRLLAGSIRVLQAPLPSEAGRSGPRLFLPIAEGKRAPRPRQPKAMSAFCMPKVSRPLTEVQPEGLGLCFETRSIG